MNPNLDPEKFYRTEDMSLATFLRLEGHTPQQVGWILNDCYWWFLITDDLLEAVHAFDSGEAIVEPREYNREFHKTRQQMFATKEPIAPANAS